MAGCFCFANPSGFLFGLSQKGTICSSGWKVVLHAEPRSRCVFFDTYGEYINTNEDGNALDAPYTMLDAPTIPNMIGAILLSRAESLLLNEARQLCVERT